MAKTTKNSSLTTDDIKHVAKLANLPLTEKEIPELQKQLSEILGYIDQLQEVDTKGIEETSQVTGLTNVSRNDIPGKTLTQKSALSNTQNQKSGYFKVPKVLNNN